MARNGSDRALHGPASQRHRFVDVGERRPSAGRIPRYATRKTGRRQVHPIARPVRRHLEPLSAGDDPRAPLFPGPFEIATANRDMSRLSQQFHDLLVSAGLALPRPPKWKPQGKGRDSPRARSEVTFHSLRHTATSLLKNAGVSEAVARDIIGHESAAISRHYTHIDESS